MFILLSSSLHSYNSCISSLLKCFSGSCFDTWASKLKSVYYLPPRFASFLKLLYKAEIFASCSMLVTFCMLIVTFCLIVDTFCSCVATSCSLLVTFFSFLVIFCSLLVILHLSFVTSC